MAVSVRCPGDYSEDFSSAKFFNVSEQGFLFVYKTEDVSQQVAGIFAPGHWEYAVVIDGDILPVRRPAPIPAQGV